MSGGLDREVTDWLKRGMALVDGVGLDYIGVHYRAGPKSWPEHASVRVESRGPDDVVQEVLGHVADIVDSGTAEGREGVPVRLKLFRSKAAAGSRTFRPPGGPAGSDPERTGDEDESPKGAMVATIHELRLLVGVGFSELASQSTNGWKMATELATQNARLTLQLAQAQAELRVGNAPQTDDVTKMALDFLPQVPAMLANLADLARARQVMKDQAESS